jgi:hypothetical protein
LDVGTLKYLESIFDEMPNLGRKRPGPQGRARGVELDEDLFVAGTGRPAGAALALKNALAPHRNAASAVDYDERAWPTLEVPAKPGPHPMEQRLADQERELAMRCTQVADLYNLQERQTAELQMAYAEIERLNATFDELQVNAARHTATSAERKQAISLLYQENAVLRSKLETALDEATVMSSKMLTIETMFNDRELVITSALEQADLLKAELTSTSAENVRLSAALERAERIGIEDRKTHTTVVDELNRKLESLFVDHGVQLKTRAKLASRCDELNKANAAFEAGHREAQAKLAAQGEHSTFLETILRVERETAEARIRELSDQLEQERMQRAVSDRAQSAMRQEMAILLRAIARQRAEAVALHQDAA